MTVSINQNYISQFSSNLFHLLGAQGSKLKGLFAEESANGEKHFFDRLGDFTVSERVSAMAPTVLQDATHSRRMATLKLYDASVGIDKRFDLNKMLIDPTSDYIKKLSNVHGQNFDVSLFEAMLGSAATGVDGTGSQAFDSNYQIAHGGTGLTVTKLDQALRMLKENRVDVMRDGIYLFINAKAEEDLLADAKITSFDYQPSKVLGGKELPSYRGIKIIQTEDIPVHTDGSVYRGILCTADMLKVAVKQDIQVEIDKRPDLSNGHQIMTTMMFGAVRMEEKRIIDILFQ